jgi:hypothetical protein
VEFKNDKGTASGKKTCVQLKNGDSYLRTRKTDGKPIFYVKNPRHLQYCVDQPVDAYLVIRDAQRGPAALAGLKQSAWCRKLCAVGSQAAASARGQGGL